MNHGENAHSDSSLFSAFALKRKKGGGSILTVPFHITGVLPSRIPLLYIFCMVI